MGGAGAATEGSEALSSSRELRNPYPAERAGGERRAASPPGDHPAGVGPYLGRPAEMYYEVEGRSDQATTGEDAEATEAGARMSASGVTTAAGNQSGDSVIPDSSPPSPLVPSVRPKRRIRQPRWTNDYIMVSD